MIESGRYVNRSPDLLLNGPQYRDGQRYLHRFWERKTPPARQLMAFIRMFGVMAGRNITLTIHARTLEHVDATLVVVGERTGQSRNWHGSSVKSIRCVKRLEEVRPSCTSDSVA